MVLNPQRYRAEYEFGREGASQLVCSTGVTNGLKLSKPAGNACDGLEAALTDK
jgi:hypothetical protein